MAEEAVPGEVQAAGAVLWRSRGGGTETALVHRPRYDDWSFPKGKSLPGEHVLLTAVREVEEETGVRPALGRSLGSQRYLADGRPKRVYYWAGRPVSPERFGATLFHALGVPPETRLGADGFTRPASTGRPFLEWFA